MNLLNKPIDCKMYLDLEGNLTFSSRFIDSFGINNNSACSFVEDSGELYITFDSRIPYGKRPISKKYKEIISDSPFYFILSSELMHELVIKLDLNFQNRKETLVLGEFKYLEKFGNAIGYKLTKC